MAAAADAAVAVAPPDHFSHEEARFKMRKLLDDLSVAPDSAAAALAAAAISLAITSAAEKMEEWYSEDDSDLHELTMVARMMLRDVHMFVVGPSCNQMAIDALSLELPGPIAKLGALCLEFSVDALSLETPSPIAKLGALCLEFSVDALSLETPSPIAKLGALCLDLSAAKSIIENFASQCSPRDTLLILWEALDTHSSVQVVNSSSYFIILLDGIGKVLPLIQRQHAHNIKMAMRAVTGCVRYTSSVLDEHNGRNATELFNEAYRFSNIVQEMCKTMVDEEKKEVTTLLGLFALQNIAFISQSKQEHSLSSAPLAIGYSQLAIASGFCWKGLLTGDDIRSAIAKIDEGLV